MHVAAAFEDVELRDLGVGIVEGSTEMSMPSMAKRNKMY